MIDHSQRIASLRFFLRTELEKKEALKVLVDEDLPRLVKDQEMDRRKRELEGARDAVEQAFDEFLIYPRQHNRHFGKLQEFYKSGGYLESVFIMTKFPDGGGPLDKTLEKVIDIVSCGVSAHGYKPRIASDKDYHENLWDNVELHLLGCSRAIAIVEDKYKQEMNPNVAMEWGWMRGMGKPVLFLVESTFDNLRADWSGLLRDPFEWGNPEPGIQAALQKWLPR